MSDATNYLTKLTCAERIARDRGYVHTGRALESLISAERARLKATLGIIAVPDCNTLPTHGYVPEDT